MSWGSHPDTMTIAQAQGMARMEGHPEGSLEWTIAYRKSYEKVGRNSGLSEESLDRYLSHLDAQISELRGPNASAVDPIETLAGGKLIIMSDETDEP